MSIVYSENQWLKPYVNFKNHSAVLTIRNKNETLSNHVQNLFNDNGNKSLSR